MIWLLNKVTGSSSKAVGKYKDFGSLAQTLELVRFLWTEVENVLFWKTHQKLFFTHLFNPLIPELFFPSIVEIPYILKYNLKYNLSWHIL